MMQSNVYSFWIFYFTQEVFFSKTYKVNCEEYASNHDKIIAHATSFMEGSEIQPKTNIYYNA